MSTYLPTYYQQYIALSRYARWLPDEGRRETWEETVDRYLDFMEQHLYNKLQYDLFADVKAELREAILNLEVMPSMRALMTAGPALERDNTAGYNCFAGDVEYVTAEGIRTFQDTAGTEQTVLAGDGQWRKATIRHFGTQKLNRVVLRPGNRSRTKLRREILVTKDHRWITTNRGEV